MARPSKYTPELRRRAVEEVLDRGRTVTEVANSLSITTPETLRRWVVQAKKDRGLITGPTTEELAEIKALRKEVADQQRTIEILKAVTTFFRPGGRPSVAVNVAFIDAHRDRFDVAVMCRVLSFPERTFYAFKARPVCARATADAAHKTLILDEWTANYSCYGARRMHKHLRRRGHRIARAPSCG
jgi:transposase-like protein